ncbi:MAG: GntR family transcriptional regulator [Acidimicrobiales bacterium]
MTIEDGVATARAPARPVIERTSATDAAAREIRALILTGELPAGMLIPQGELAEQLGLSRTPLREALQRLQAEGLIRIDNHRGAVVARPTLEDVAQIYEVQVLLEAEAARWAALACTPDDLVSVREVLERHRRSPGGVSWMESNKAFHTSVYRVARRPVLLEMIGLLRNRAGLYVNFLARSPEGRARADAEHQEMYEALAAGDADGLSDLVRRHLQGTLDWLQTVIPK